MKLTVGTGARARGFALPTILLVSTVMFTILVASIGAAAASRVSLDSQYYNLLARQAAQSGIARATECLESSGYTPQWSTLASNRDLRPNSTCAGTTMTGGGVSPYVVGDGVGPDLNVRTKYSIEAPSGSGIGSILQVVGTTELVRSSSPNSVWRSYSQSLYHRIEAPQTISCPSGFVSVPGDSRFGTNDFCISKYEAKNVGGKAASQATGTPFVSISQDDASVAAANACSGCHLVSEAEWLTVAHNVTSVTGNWSGNSVGSGYIYSGHNDNSPAHSLEASSNDDDGYFGTSNSSGNQRRTLMLNNGEVIWDFSGNVWEWTSGQKASEKPGGSGIGYREWSAVEGTGTVSPNPFPSFGTPAASAWNSSDGIGRLYSNSDDTTLRAFARGGSWSNGASAGIFTTRLDLAPTTPSAFIGFRVAYTPLSELSCPSGFIPVPGNSSFGTNDFCVAKYETKDVGGEAGSQPGGLPTVNTSQLIAVLVTILSDSCVNCSVISEAQWLTIAHNIASVPSNWTGGSVGSGTIYRGHTDNSPSTRLAASSNDNNGYYGTANASGDQRRTLTLSNGEVIWDFSGNVWEWTSGTITGGQPGESGYSWRQWNTLTNSSLLTPDPSPIFTNPAAASWNNTHGIGMIYSSTAETEPRAFLRGGNWSDSNGYGIFSLALSRGTDTGYADTGYRLTVRPY